jgi:succinate dehydrogenase hydrophobic anchor subunit
VRYWLPILPLSVTAFAVTAGQTKNKWVLFLCVAVLVVSVVCSVLGMQQILADHASYVQAFGSDESIL